MTWNDLAGRLANLQVPGEFAHEVGAQHQKADAQYLNVYAEFVHSFPGSTALHVSMRSAIILDYLRHFLGVIRNIEEVEILLRNASFGQHGVFKPLDQGGPVPDAKQDNRKVFYLLSLSERKRFKELVNGPVTAREDDKRH